MLWVPWACSLLFSYQKETLFVRIRICRRRTCSDSDHVYVDTAYVHMAALMCILVCHRHMWSCPKFFLWSLTLKTWVYTHYFVSYLQYWLRYSTQLICLIMAAMICIKTIRRTFCWLVNIANRFLHICSDVVIPVKSIFPRGLLYPPLPTRVYIMHDLSWLLTHLFNCMLGYP